MEERTYGRRSVGRTHDVITKPKFLALMGLPKSLSYGAPRMFDMENDMARGLEGVVIYIFRLA